jgi:hypothetical protein
LRRDDVTITARSPKHPTMATTKQTRPSAVLLKESTSQKMTSNGA